MCYQLIQEGQSREKREGGEERDEGEGRRERGRREEGEGEGNGEGEKGELGRRERE